VKVTQDIVPPTASIDSQINVLCYGKSTGSVTIKGSGGRSPYSYKLGSGGYQTSGTFSNLAAGSYTVTVKDSNGCTTTQDVTITQPVSSLTVSIAAPAVITCAIQTASLKASVSGGTEPYTYSWSPGGQTDKDITVSAPGTYTLTATGANGCSASASVGVDETLTPNPAVLFSYSPSYSIDMEYANDVALGDLDNDGDLDVVVANDATAPNAIWLNDTASGSFTLFSTLISMYYKKDDGQVVPYTGSTSDSAPFTNSTEVILEDFDQDGDLDIAFGSIAEGTDYIPYDPTQTPAVPYEKGLGSGKIQNNLEVWRNDLQSSGDKPNMTLDYINYGLAASNGPGVVEGIAKILLDTDSKVDLVVVESNYLTLFRNTSTENAGSTDISFKSETQFDQFATPQGGYQTGKHAVIGDFYGSEDSDILIVMADGYQIWENTSTASKLNLALAVDQRNHLWSWCGSAGCEFTRAAMADLDNDSDMDLVLASGQGRSAYLLNDGTGSGVLFEHQLEWTSTTCSTCPTRSWAQDLALDDINGDCWPDIVFNSDTASGQTVILWFNLGESASGKWLGFKPPAHLEDIHVASARGVSIGDINGDSCVDIVFGVRGQSMTGIWLSTRTDPSIGEAVEAEQDTERGVSVSGEDTAASQPHNMPRRTIAIGAMLCIAVIVALGLRGFFL